MKTMFPQLCHDSGAIGRRPTMRQALRGAARRAAAMLGVWQERRRGRRQLALLDERALGDIGLSPAQRDFLVNKPFWHA